MKSTILEISVAISVIFVEINSERALFKRRPFYNQRKEEGLEDEARLPAN
jgi:hypothetical protein